MEESVEMRVFGNGEVDAIAASLVLRRVSDAYAGLIVLDFIANTHARSLISLGADVDDGFHLDVHHSIWTHVALENEDILLKGVRLESPGFWEFLGQLNPMEVIRKFLSDNHERKKDNDYRNRMEEQRMEIENLMLHQELIAKCIDNCRSAGVKEKHLTKFVRDNATIPLGRLETLQDAKLISYAEITTGSPERKPTRAPA